MHSGAAFWIKPFGLEGRFFVVACFESASGTEAAREGLALIAKMAFFNP